MRWLLSSVAPFSESLPNEVGLVHTVGSVPPENVFGQMAQIVPMTRFRAQPLENIIVRWGRSVGTFTELE
jgi:hypothetical protein